MEERTRTVSNQALVSAKGLGVLLVLGLLLCSCSSGQGVSAGIPTSTALPPARTINAAQAYQLYQQGVAFLDVRDQAEWVEGHIPGATLLPSKEVINRYSELPMDIQLVLYCSTGERSAEAARFLQGVGFNDVSSLEGGLESWIAAGYEVDTGR